MMSDRTLVRLIDKISPTCGQMLPDCFLNAAIENPDGVIVRNTKIDPRALPKSVKWIARAGTGVDNIDPMDAATERGIVVFYAPGMNAQSVAEHVFRLLGNHFRPLSESQRFVSDLSGKTHEEMEDAIKKGKSKYTGHELFGRTIGIVGAAGNIGQRIARIALGYGMEVVGCDIKQQEIPGVRWSDMEGVLRSSDIVTIHASYLPGINEGLIGRDQLAAMRPGAILVNTARAELVDSAAILEAIHDPQAPLSAYLTDLPTPDIIDVKGITCTPHIGASTPQSQERCAESIGRDIGNFIRFGVIRNAKNFPSMEIFPRSAIVTRLSIIHRNIEGMIYFMSGVLARYGVNIADHKTTQVNGIAYSVIDLECPLPFGALEKVAVHEKILRVHEIRFDQ
ncbi:hypothetical protein HZC00_00765 [Candidatus Kaiserbacteria bacterium]|nr:hypothetical protein [Candidatus Kaiserbacteria bacterium]